MDQTAVVYLVLGFLAGFGVEWAYDFFIARRRLIPSPDPELKALLERTQAEKEALVKQVASLEPLKSIVDLKQGELESMKLEVARAAANETELKSRIAQLQQSRGEEGDLAPSSLQDMSGFDERLDQLMQQLAAKDQELDDMAQRLKAALSDQNAPSVGQLNQLAEQYEQTMATMKCELMEQEQIILDLEAKLTDFEDPNLTGSVARKKDPFQNMDHTQSVEVLDDLRAVIVMKDAELMELRRELESSKSQLLSSEDQRVLKSLNEALQRDVESLKVVSAAKDLAVSESQAALAQLEAQLAFRPLAEDFASLKSELEQKQKESETLVEDTAAKYAEELETLKSALEAKESEVATLTTSFETLQQESQRYPAENESLRAELETRQRSMEELTAKIQSLEEAVASHPEGIEALKSEIEASEHRVIALTTSLSEVQSTVDARTEELERLKAELDSRDSDHDNLRLKVLELEGVTQTHPEELNRLHSELADKHRSNLEMESRLDFLQAEIIQRDQIIEGMRSVLKPLTDFGQQAPVAPPVQPEEPSPVLSVAPAAPAGPTRFEGMSRKDSFIQINGIGHLYERKLWDAGVTTFEKLANLSTDEVFEIIQPAEWQRIEPEKWIAEAARRSLGTGT